MQPHTSLTLQMQQQPELELEPEPEPERPERPERQERPEWRPRNDPRLARVVELEGQGESAAAARLLRVVLGSLDPERAKPRLHARLAALEQRHGQGGANGRLDDAAAALDGDAGVALQRTRSATVALAEAAAERQRREAAHAVVDAQREEHAELDAETRLLRQAIAVFNAGAQLARSLETAGFECTSGRHASGTPRGRGLHGQWYCPESPTLTLGVLVEIDPAIAGGIEVTVPWARYRDRHGGSGTDDSTANADLAAWLELTLASDPSGGSFGPELLRWLDDYTLLNSSEADPAAKSAAAAAAAAGGFRRAPEPGENPEAVDVGLSRLPPAAALGATAERPLTIYTWGDALSSKAALRQLGSQLDVNAKPLNGRGGGANTRYNALQDNRIMRNVVSSLSEGSGLLVLKRTVDAIEAGGLDTVSIFCTKGRHRCESHLLRPRTQPPERSGCSSFPCVFVQLLFARALSCSLACLYARAVVADARAGLVGSRVDGRGAASALLPTG